MNIVRTLSPSQGKFQGREVIYHLSQPIVMGPRRKVSIPLRRPKAAKHQHGNDVSSSRTRSSSEELDEDVQEDISFDLREGNKLFDDDNMADVGSHISSDLGEGSKFPDGYNEAEVGSYKTCIALSILTFNSFCATLRLLLKVAIYPRIWPISTLKISRMLSLTTNHHRNAPTPPTPRLSSRPKSPHLAHRLQFGLLCHLFKLR